MMMSPSLSLALIQHWAFGYHSTYSRRATRRVRTVSCPPAPHLCINDLTA